jgi:hypothetical protein
MVRETLAKTLDQFVNGLGLVAGELKVGRYFKLGHILKV